MCLESKQRNDVTSADHYTNSLHGSRVKRFPMRNWLLPVAMFFPLVLSGQADTSQFIPTSETRDSREFIRNVITVFRTVKEPGIINPYLEVGLTRWTCSQRTQERRYVDRNVLTPDQRKSLKYSNFFHRPADIGVQGLPEESMIWKRENEILPLSRKPGQDIPHLDYRGRLDVDC